MSTAAYAPCYTIILTEKMKLIIKHIFLLFILHSLSFCTEQQKDTLIYQNYKYELFTHWSYPSPLEIFFKNNGEVNPFKSDFTANYRGHVATWELKDCYFYLKRIYQLDLYSRPTNKIPLKDIFHNISDDTKIWASWFTGIVLIMGPVEPNIVYKNCDFIFLEIKIGILLRSYYLKQQDYLNYIDCYYYNKTLKNPNNKLIFDKYYKYENSFHAN